MKNIILTVLTAFVLVVSAFGQQPGEISPGIRKHSPTEDSIRAMALDYSDGYYSGNGDRMSRAIHPDLNKAFPRYIARTGMIALNYSTYSSLVEASYAKAGFLPDTARHISVSILYIDPPVATVRVNSAQFNDYLQMIRINGEWKIINVLWNSPQNAGWIKEKDPDKEKKNVETAVMAYIQGMQRADMGKLKDCVAPDFSRVSMIQIGTKGRSAIQRTRFEALLENARAGTGRQDEALRNNDIQFLDMMDGISMVRVQTANNIEFLQVYKDPQGWKVFNSLSTPRADLELQDLLPAIAGEPMPLFKLPVYQGGDFVLQDHKGKNILLMFPRGRVGNGWCLFCQYQYLELADLEKKEQIQKKYNLEVVFVLPYAKELIDKWFSTIPESMKTLEGIRNPPAGQGGKTQQQFAGWTRAHFPKSFDLSAGNLQTAFPMLIDEKKTLSKRLKLFTEFWDGVQSEQNISAIYLIDKNGILRWKYISQMTEDRPSMDHLFDIVGKILK